MHGLTGKEHSVGDEARVAGAQRAKSRRLIRSSGKVIRGQELFMLIMSATI